MTNPLLTGTTLPDYTAIQSQHMEPAIDLVLQQNRELVAKLETEAVPNWQNFVQPLADAENRLGLVWGPISHLNSVKTSEAIRQVYNRCREKLTLYYTELGQNSVLYQQYAKIKHSAEFGQLALQQQASIEHILRDFTLSGVALEGQDRERYREITQKLSQLTNQFAENVLAATDAWSKHINEESQLVGLPAAVKQLAAQRANEKGKEGFLLTLDFPSYIAVMSHCQNRQLREQLYHAFITRASDQADQPDWDNSRVMEEIVSLRHEMAKLLGFANYSDYSLATKMAESPQQVIDFLQDLALKTRTVAEQEYQTLCDYAEQRDHVEALAPWDVPYYSELQKQQLFSISEEALKPYFPLEKVLAGMFKIASQLFDVDIHPESNDEISVWDQQVRRYSLKRGSTVLAQFYIDLFAREQKRAGAWMNGAVSKHSATMDEDQQVPVAYLVCNFMPAAGSEPALLTHNEVTTLFHEFGHGLHHMLTRVSVSNVSGINGVAWDAVELPSQFLENWCWNEDTLPLISGHYASDEPLPKAMLDNLIAAKNYQSGMMMLRQLEFALFDFQLHLDAQTTPLSCQRIQDMLSQVREQVAVYEVPDYYRFQHSFSHIFAGGYAAGYYSYKWAEVLSADAFSRFEQEGLLNPQLGKAFCQSILENGGVESAMVLFKRFMGREPDATALLKHSGILKAA